jgi:uncharacterized membrane protein YhaH (DUF805 family)
VQRLRELLRFDGRLSRLGYWRAYLLLAIATAVVWCGALFAILAIGPVGGLFLAPLAPLVLASVAIAVRRLHDRDRSGWWALPFIAFPLVVRLAMSAEAPAARLPTMELLVSLVSAVLSIWGFIEIGFGRSAPGPNRYGEAPAATA